MARYLARRLLHSLLVLAAIMAVTFVVFQVLGDPVRRILPLNASDEQVEAFSQANGFSDPFPTRFARFVGDVVTLDFDDSYTLRRDPLPAVLDALPRTAILAGAAFALAAVGGVALGVAAAVNRGGRIDRGVSTAGVVVVSMAEFWIGLILVVLFAVHLGWLPTSGYGTGTRLVLPAVTLAVTPMGRIAYFTRNSVVAALDEPHVAFATSLGMPRSVVLGRYVLPGASLPLLALAGVELTRMLVGGALVVELVFAWPGSGRLYATAMERYDLPLVTAAILVATVIVLVLNLLLDLLYARIDPRVRLA
ncbi:MAG: ABC transporter permease [Acidimicrobiia bacterium]